MIDFLLEIGFEEFPPSLLKKTATELSEKIENLLNNKRIFYRSIRTIYTPRRAGALVLGLTRKQKAQIIQIQGPPKKMAYDKNSKPSEMLLGFMKSNDLKPNQIFITRSQKGEYVCGKKELPGTNTEEILYNEIPNTIKSLEFPKTMVWDKHKVPFPRPIRWIVCLLDRRPLRFEYAGVKADRYAWPNYHFSFKPIRLEKPREYLNFLRHGGVVVDPNERKKLILTRIKQIADRLKGKPIYDDNMIEEINCMTEYPEAINGEFQNHYLELPEEVLRSVLKTNGNLIWLKDTNKFISIFSAKKKALINVQKGYTRVIEARLCDALFYYKNDKNHGLLNMREKTKGMLWLTNLGTIYDKAERLNRFVEKFKNVADLDIDALKRAALLCKADLFSQMVRDMEFTSLQGIMGYYYAKESGENEKVAMAIKEHYLPKFIGDELPRTKEGAFLSITDKLDNVLGAFLIDQRPSGSFDPLAIRRNGYAIVNLIDAHSINILLYKAIDELLKLYDKDFNKKNIYEFFVERLNRYLQDKEFRYDEINSVLANWDGDVVDARMKCEALKNFRNKPEFTKLVIGQKRVRNILKGAKDSGAVNPEAFTERVENDLYKKGRTTESLLEVALENRNYIEVLNLLLGMHLDIDKFFDDVLVMCPDEKLKRNRLALINFINLLFLKFADFSQIVIEGEKNQE